MALLRKSLRLWIRSVRLYSAEAQIPSPKFMKTPKPGWRVTPDFLSKHGNLTITKWLKDNEAMSPDKWLAARHELLSSKNFTITEATVDMTIVNLCLQLAKVNPAMLYLQYLWDNNYKMNLMSMMTYLKLCYVRKKGELSESEKEYLLKMYNEIRSQYPVVDGTTAECCIMGITKTNRWKESVELLETTKTLDNPRPVTYTAIICAAFRNNEPEIGWKYLREILIKRNPDHSAYIAYLDYCTKNFKAAELEMQIGKMMEFWGDSDVRPYVDVISAYEKAFNDLGWYTHHTSISDKGVCRSCSHTLSRFDVVEEQFAKLAQTVRDRVIVGEDIYRKTTPQEFKKFLDFVEKTQPYDIVIDGLNVSYLSKSKTKPNGSQLSDVFRTCLKMGKKVLVLGRQHMLNWPKLDYEFMRQNGHVFLANDLSEDDPYMLFATLRSGPHTLFVSKDLMRQHKFLLEDQELTRIFKYWQLTHQVTPMGIKNEQGTRLILKNPPMYVPLAQKDDGGFHVPYTTDPSLQPALIYEPPKSWVCFRKSKPPSTKKKAKLKNVK